MYRQGDILIHAVPAPAGWDQIRARSADLRSPLHSVNSLTVALGEATGHHHTLVADAPADAAIDAINVGTETEPSWLFGVLTPDGVRLTHQEHAELTIPPAPEGMVYRVTRQREIDPLANRARRVWD